MTEGTTTLPDSGRSVDLGAGVSAIRVLYPDLHGSARGKDVPFEEFDHARHGLTFCSAVMATDLRHTPVLGGEEGYPDMVAVPDASTLIRIPWEPEVACCLSDIESVPGGPAVADPRGLLRRVVGEYEELGLDPIVGPELEFFLLEEDGEGRIKRRVDRPSMVYTVGPQADPDGFVRRLSEQLAAMNLGAFAMNHEYMNSQYEINLHHGGALEAADRAFLLRALVKDAAAQSGLLATFIGKPFNDQGGSGLHVHVSLDRDGANAFDDPQDPDGVSDCLRWFTAGVIEHAAGSMAFLNPTINAYRRLMPDSLAPTHSNWGWDNRGTMIRIPAERGAASRVELRVGDASANAYLALAAILIAGLDGIRNEKVPPPPVSGDAYRAAAPGGELPHSLGEALAALRADAVLTAAIGPELIDPFLAIKDFEIERHRAWVSDWEVDEYLRHL